MAPPGFVRSQTSDALLDPFMPSSPVPNERLYTYTEFGTPGPQLLCADSEDILLRIFCLNDTRLFLIPDDFSAPDNSIDCPSRQRFQFSGSDFSLITAGSSTPADQKPLIFSPKYHMNSSSSLWRALKLPSETLQARAPSSALLLWGLISILDWSFFPSGHLCSQEKSSLVSLQSIDLMLWSEDHLIP